jgi:hypothetical protein
MTETKVVAAPLASSIVATAVNAINATNRLRLVQRIIRIASGHQKNVLC